MKLAKNLRLFRFSVRTVLIVLTVLCVWLGVQVNQARDQRQVVDWVRASGGDVEYEHEYRWSSSDGPSQANYEDYAPGLKWLRDLVGEQYFFRIRRINVRSPNPGLDDISVLASARHVKDLDLGRMQVRDLSPLSRFSELEELGLVEMPVSNLSGLRRLVKLQSLNICYTENLEDISDLAYLSNLKYLRLMNTQIRDLSPLERLRNLETIRVRFTPVRDISPMSKMQRLERLELEWTNVDDLSPLTNLTRLKTLVLSGTQVSDEEVEKLRAALPNCQIQRDRRTTCPPPPTLCRWSDDSALQQPRQLNLGQAVLGGVWRLYIRQT